MQLDEFVKATLEQIAVGVKEAEVAEHGAAVNPRGTYRSKTGELTTSPNFANMVCEVDFDVAVTTTEGTEASGGVGIMIASVGLGATGKSDHSNSVVSRIKFQIPLQLPVHTEQP